MNPTGDFRSAPGCIAALGAVCAMASLVACTSAPHVGHDAFRDAWGDRGPQVFARDLRWCAEAVESRRSLLAGCMQQRGWLSSPDGATAVPGRS